MAEPLSANERARAHAGMSLAITKIMRAVRLMLNTLKKSLFVALIMLCGSAHAELPQDCGFHGHLATHSMSI